jgi:homoserine O-acetyltransferase
MGPRPAGWSPCSDRAPIDTNQWRVICVNSVGSCEGSTGPASCNPATGETWGIALPALSIEDIADAAAFAARALNFNHIDCVIGNSMGAMVFANSTHLHPQRVTARSVR